MSKDGTNDDGTQQGSGGESTKKDADIFENRGSKKIVRLITVAAYMFSVSFVAIVLSGYYLFLWEPPNPNLLRRPVHLSSEPELQFFLSDEPSAVNEANQLINNSNVSQPFFSGRVADVDEIASDYKEAVKRREKWDKSLLLLRNSLVNFLENNTYSSKSLARNLFEKNGSISKTSNTTSLMDEKMSNSKNTSTVKSLTHSSKIVKRTFNYNDSPSTLDMISTISGNETNNVHIASTSNKSIPELAQKDSRLNYNLLTNVVDPLHNSLPIIKTKRLYKKDKRIGIFKYWNMSSEGYSNATETTKRYAPGFVMTVNSENGPRSQKSSKDRAYQTSYIRHVFNLSNELTTSSSHDLEYTNRLTNLQRSYQLPIKLTNIALTIKETQMQNVTNKSEIMENQQIPLSRNITTEQQRNILTALREIARTPSAVMLNKNATTYLMPNSYQVESNQQIVETLNTTQHKEN